MKLFSGWVVSAGLVLTAATASAQGVVPRDLAPYKNGGSRYAPVSDFEGPYAAMPPEAPGPRYGGPMPRYGGPMLLPPEEVYAVVRENGFSPLGAPRQRGLVYVISVIAPAAAHGPLLLHPPSARIIPSIAPPGARARTPPRRGAGGGTRREERPRGARRVAPPPRKAAGGQQNRAEVHPPPPAAAPPVVEANPAAPQIQPTQEMPKAQGLE